MNQGLPTPDVVRRHAEDFFHRSAPALTLRWPDGVAQSERLWELPDGVSIMGPPPEQFGYHIQRVGADSYTLRLLWNQTCLNWAALSRVQLLGCALSPLLAALGTDLWCLLDQPTQGVNYSYSRAA